MRTSSLFIGAGMVVVSLTAAAPAQPISDDLPFLFHNLPDGNQSPPLYGLRLDGLDGVTNHRFTFDFDYVDAATDREAEVVMTLDRDARLVRIVGDMYGGLNDLSDSDEYAATTSGWVGWWHVDFMYTDGVRDYASDGGGLTDIVAGPDHRTGPAPTNADTLTRDFASAAADETYELVDHASHYEWTFRFGNEDGPGHRGHDGLSGWGWVNHSGYGTGPYYSHVAASDWLFTAEPIPAPDEMILAMTGLGLAGWLRRRFIGQVQPRRVGPIR